MVYGQTESKLTIEMNVLHGAKKKIEVPDIAIGQWIFNTLKSCDPNLQFLIEGDTDRVMTAGQALNAAVSFALALKEFGINPGDRVAAIGLNTIEISVAAMGVMFIGAVLSPYDPLHRTYEFQHLLKLTQPKIAICDLTVIEDVQDAISKVCPHIPLIVMESKEDIPNTIRFDSLITEVDVESFVPASCDDIKKEILVIICSSGTTGLPKGVALSHWACSYQSMILSGFLTGAKRLLHTSYFYWVSGVLLMIVSGTLGVPRVLVKTSEPLDSLKAIDKYQPEMSIFAPSLLAAIVLHPQHSAYNLQSLKIIVAGGSPIQKRTIELVSEVIPKTIVVQGYGATEVGGLVSKTNAYVDTLSAGLLSDNMSVRVVDRDTGEDLPANQEGELLLLSPSVMIGYYNNPEATNDAIVDGWYKSGDIGYYTEKGLIYLTGRAKELLKVDNHQISPSEIEQVIMLLVGVNDVIVVGIPVEENSYPAALVIKEEGATITEDDIKQAVADTLSDFKQLRGGVYFVESIPRTSTGKLKRRDIQPLAEELYWKSHNK